MHGIDTWAVVLAGGNGVRLLALARALCGTDLPKQFLPLLDGRSLLQATLDRISPRFDHQRIVVVVGDAYYAVHLISQPRNLGTGPGILLPLAWMRARDPDARIAMFPSDHHVPHPELLLDGVQRALDSTRFDRVVLGVEADLPETDLGWIVSHHIGHALGPVPCCGSWRNRRVRWPNSSSDRGLSGTPSSSSGSSRRSGPWPCARDPV
jgi:mannose-1-phosphate guanylyltransferase